MHGSDAPEVPLDAIAPGDRVLIVDDVIATGGTAAAAIDLVVGLGADVVGLALFIELAFLNGRAVLSDDVPIHAVVTYE